MTWTFSIPIDIQNYTYLYIVLLQMKLISMECSSSSTQPAESVSSSNRRRVEEELNQLSRVVSNGDCRSAEALVTKILCSFRNILCILNGTHHGSEGPLEKLISHSPANGIALPPPPPPPHPPILESSVSDDAHNAVKRPTAFMDHRDSFKRIGRKKMTPQAWFRDSPDLNDDGHAWRKYGQKSIQNAIYPRSYFRCSHKHDQGCIATKQVQKLDDDPQRFRTTYIGNHTCTNSFLKAPEFVLDTTSSTPQSDSKFVIIYGNSSNGLTNTLTTQEQPLFSSMKDDLIIESSHTTGNQQSSSLSSSGYPVPPDRVVFESSEPISGMPPQIELDLEDMFIWAEMEQLPFDEEIFSYELW